MSEQKNFNDILTRAYKRMHRYTCGEASLQALLELWDLPVDTNSWATAGYLGAIGSGNTTCGLLIGSSIGIGLRCGHGIQGTPEQNEDARQKAIQAVNELYNEFLTEFGSTDCKTLNKVDFREGEEISEWMIQKGWKQTCDVFLNFTMRKCLSMGKDGKL
ncbi:MAG: C_GCAxxG_C_C family protein [Candidatus Heimdallarchaeota archaeon]|nr:MAG: C_GCAxxG_C_C family protein [Candidatus Heimdallarchaeota archaeon]